MILSLNMLLPAFSSIELEAARERYMNFHGHQPNEGSTWKDWRAVLTMPVILDVVENAILPRHLDREDEIRAALADTVVLLSTANKANKRSVAGSNYTIAWTAQYYGADLSPAYARLDTLINDLDVLTSVQV